MRYVNSIRDVDSAEAERQYKEYVKDIALSMFETSLKELNLSSFTLFRSCILPGDL